MSNQQTAWTYDSVYKKRTKKEYTSYRYVFHGTPLHKYEWAIVVLDDYGMFAVVSDYGNYIHHWNTGALPMPFRSFVAKDLCNDTAYILGKFLGEPTQKDIQQTVKEMKRHIVQTRRNGGYEKDFARKEFNSVKHIATEMDLDDFLLDTELADASDFIVRKHSKQAQNFASRILPRLKQAILEELALEAKGAG